MRIVFERKKKRRESFESERIQLHLFLETTANEFNKTLRLGHFNKGPEGEYADQDLGLVGLIITKHHPITVLRDPFRALFKMSEVQEQSLHRVSSVDQFQGQRTGFPNA